MRFYQCIYIVPCLADMYYVKLRAYPNCLIYTILLKKDQSHMSANRNNSLLYNMSKTCLSLLDYRSEFAKVATVFPPPDFKTEPLQYRTISGWLAAKNMKESVMTQATQKFISLTSSRIV